MKHLTILVVSANGVGHVNSCIGTMAKMVTRGHRVIFFVEEAFKGKLETQGFEEHLYRLDLNPEDNVEEFDENLKQKKNVNPGEKMANDLLEKKIIGPVDLIQRFNNLVDYFLLSDIALKTIIQSDKQLKDAIELYNPDLFLVDNAYLLPVIATTGKPWIKNISTTPTFLILNEQIPPGGVGFSANSKPESWLSFQESFKKLFYSKKLNDIFQEMGYDRYENDMIMPETQALTVYAYPEELNYPKLPEITGYFNLEVFNKNETKDVVTLENLVPKKLFNSMLNENFSGKWIYFSMGSMGSVDLSLMKRLLKVLANTNHKYIVSKGPRHEEYELPSNMWGDRYLPQTKIIPLVDLVITHGGNNTVTETFAEGKPMVVLPLFADQMDNGQRLHETGLGIRVEPYSFNDNELIHAIEKLLNDQKLHEKLKKAAHRIQTSNKHEKFCEMIENIFESY